MPDQWMSVAEAAATLKVHPRTVERRIVAGKIDTRRDESGQVQILVNVPEAAASVASPESIETVRELADRQVDIAAGSASALVRVAQETVDRISSELANARQDLTIARTDVAIARRGARVAWSVVGTMAALIMVAIGWSTHEITAARSEIVTKLADVDRISQEKRDLQAESVAVKQRADEQLIARSRAEGELAAYKGDLESKIEQSIAARNAKPTTRPGSLVQRLASALSESAN